MKRPAAGRIALTGAIVFHLAAVGSELAPTTAGSLEYLPDLLRPPVRAVLPVTRFISEYTAWYLDILLLRQSWDLFGPDPVAWSQSLEVTVFYPTGGARAQAGTNDTPGAALGSVGSTAAWTADRVFLYGAPERPLPHWLDHREDRVTHNLGSPGWEGYVPILGAYLCRSVPARDGRRPAALSLANLWEETKVSWRPVSSPGTQRQELGGHTCAEGEEGR